MGLDPAWATLLVAAEGAALRQVTICFRAPGRYAARRDDIDQSVEDGYSNTLTRRLGTVIQRVFDIRRPERETNDGTVPAEPIEDVLASADLFDECEELADALQLTLDARICATRCVRLQVAEGFALCAVMLLLPIALWQPLTDDRLLTGAPLHVVNTLLALAAVAAAALFMSAIWAENALDRALVRHQVVDEHIG